MEVMKQLRQQAIRDLVVQRPVRTQAELAAALRDRGFRTTQATISRDVAELGLVKVVRGGIHAYALLDNLLTLRRQIKAGKGVRIFSPTPKNYTEVFCSKAELLGDLRRAGFAITRFERVGFYPAPERQGFLQPYMPWLAGHPRLHGALLAAFRTIQGLRVFNQKMLVRCVKPGAAPAASAHPNRKAAA